MGRPVRHGHERPCQRHGLHAQGEVSTTTDNAGRVDETVYDDEARKTDWIENYDPGSTAADENVNTRTIYGQGNNVAKTEVITSSGTQTTTYVYDSVATGGASGPALYSNENVTAVIYPDSSTTYSFSAHAFYGSDLVQYTYDRQAEMTTMTDQNQTTHTYSYTGLGSLASDDVTVPEGNPANIDLSVNAIDYAYKACGRLQYVTSYGPDSEDPPEEVIKNQLYFDYDSNGNLDAEYQSHDGAVDTSTSEYVAYGYDNTVTDSYDPALSAYVYVAVAGFRPTTLQYPTTGTDSSRVISDSYGTTGGTDDEINQLDAIVDGTGTADDPTTGDTLNTIASMGDGSITAETYNQPDIGYNLLGTTTIAGVATPNLNQFNRVQNLIWSNYGTSATAAGNEYQRNAKGDVTVNVNAVDAVFSELYTNDELDQITSLTRGTVSDGAIASPTYTENFTLEGNGDISSVTENGGATQDRTFNNGDQVQNYDDGSDASTSDWATPEYDTAGNSLVTPNPSDPTNALNVKVDGWNDVVQISDAGDTVNVTYAYDGLHDMIYETNTLAASGTVATTDFYYSGQQMLEADPRLPSSPTDRRNARSRTSSSILRAMSIRRSWTRRPRTRSCPALGRLPPTLITS